MAHVVAAKPHAAAAKAEQRTQAGSEGIQQQLYAAYAAVFDLHSNATQLLIEGMALFAAHYSPDVNSVKCSTSSPLQSSVRQQRDAVEDLLLRFTNMQTQLMLPGSPSRTHKKSSGRGGEDNGNNSKDNRWEVREAIQFLEHCLPTDWRDVIQLSGFHAKTSTVDQEGKQSHDHKASSSHTHPQTTAAAAAAASPEVVSCPSDVVQLALLLRRHWTLQRDITIAIPALLDLHARLRDEESTRKSKLTVVGVEEMAPPLSVAVALALLQLRTAQETLETRRTSDDTGLYTPTEQSFMQSFSNPRVSAAAAAAMTTLPLLLWQAWVRNEEEDGEEGTRQSMSSARHAASTAAVDGDENTTEDGAASLTKASKEAAAHSYTTARALTKQLCKWEAYIAAYVATQLAGRASLSLTEEAKSSAGNNKSAVIITDADARFFSAAQLELNALRGACGATQLVWLTLDASLHPLPPSLSSPPAQQSRVQVLADVAKRCRELEKLLRAFWPSAVTARLLLPGILLWLGYATDKRGHASSEPSAQPHSAYWQEAYTLGEQVLGPSHPFVKALAALFPHFVTAEANRRVSAPVSAEVKGEPRAYASAVGPLTAAQAPTRASTLPAFPQHTRWSNPLLPPLPQLAAPPTHITTMASGQSYYPSPPPPRVPISATRNVSLSSTAAAMMPRPPNFAHAFTMSSFSSKSPPQQALDQHSTQRACLPPAFLRHSHDPRLQSLSGNEAGVASPPKVFSSTLPLANPMKLSAAAASAPTRSTLPLPHLRYKLQRNSQQDRAALRNCHHLHDPADAFKLISSVPDAVFEDEATKKMRAAQRAEKKKKRLRGKKMTMEALLLSATAEDSMSSVNDAALSEANTEEGKEEKRLRRRRRPDRQLLSTLTSTLRPVSAPGSTKTKIKQADPLNPVMNESSPLTQDDGKEDLSSGVDATVNAGSPRSETAAATAMQGSRQGAASFAASHTSDIKEGEDGDKDKEEDEEDEGYDAETLPERNGRLRREIRTYYAQLNYRRVRAAAVIQRGWRCSRARHLLQERQQLLFRYVHWIQKAAALAIESFVLCVWEQRKRRDALEARKEASAQRRVWEHRQVAAAQVLTRAARQWGQRQRERRRLCEQLNVERDARLQRYAIAAVAVQRWWRLIAPQKAYWRRRNVEVAEQQRQQAEADRLARMATIIQKRVRGVQARSRVDGLRRTRAAEAQALRLKRDAAVTVLTLVLQEYALRQARLVREAAEHQARQENAVQRIAENWKAALARRRVDVALYRARQLRIAATCIERAWRRYFAARQRRYLRQLRRTIEEERLAHELHESTSLLLLQSAARGALDRLLVYKLKARVGRTFMESVLLIQAVLRGGQDRQALGQARLVEYARRRAEAAALEQRRLRAICSIQAVTRARHSAYAVQRRRRRHLEEKVHVYSTAAREMREEAAANVVQRAVRRYQQRQRAAAADAEAAAAFQYLHRMARCLQQAWRAYAARQERRRRAAAVAYGAQKREEQEEVMELVWRDQRREMDVLHTLEQQYIVEAEHAARMALYHGWLHSSDQETEMPNNDVPVHIEGRSDDVSGWAELYVD